MFVRFWALAFEYSKILQADLVFNSMFGLVNGERLNTLSHFVVPPILCVQAPEFVIWFGWWVGSFTWFR